VATDWAAWRAAAAYPARLGALPVAAAAVLCVRGGIGGWGEGYRTWRRKNVFPPRAGTEPKWPDDIRARTRVPRLETVHVYDTMYRGIGAFSTHILLLSIHRDLSLRLFYVASGFRIYYNILRDVVLKVMFQHNFPTIYIMIENKEKTKKTVHTA